MVEETSRLNVEVDGRSAVGNVDRISAAFDRLNAAVARSQAMFARLSRSSSTAFARMRAAGAGAFRVLTAGFRGLQRVAGTFMSVFRTLTKLVLGAGAVFTLFARGVTDSGNAINKFVNTLLILKGNVSDATQELQWLFETANKLGTSFTAAAQPFTKFAAAAAGTLSDRSIRDVFESFATVGVALQLSQSEVTGVFLALQQIASKGVVSMEELRLQLAERVPGAMRLAASSMSMTMLEFEEAVRDRTINAGEFLENFSAKLRQTFGAAAQLASTRLFAKIQRLGNELTSFRFEIFQSGFEEGLKNLVDSAINFLRENPELAQALGRFSKGIFDDIARFLDSLSADRVVNIMNQIIGAFESLINAINTLVFMINKAFGDELGDAIGNVNRRTIDINRLIAARARTVQSLERLTKGDDPAGLKVLGIGLDEEDRQREMTKMAEKIVRQNQELSLQKDLLVSARMAAKELGAEFEALPGGLLTPLETGASPARTTLPRIDLLPEGPSGVRDIRNQPAFPPATTGAVLSALEEAEVMSTMKTPQFFRDIASSAFLNRMDELQKMLVEYNRLLRGQDELLDQIRTREDELNRVRTLPESEVKAEVLNTLIREQSSAMETYTENQQAAFEMEKKINSELERRTKLQEQIKSFQMELEETFTSVRDVMFNSIKSIEDTIVDFVETGKFEFKNLADAIIRELARMAIQAFLTRFILGPLLGGISGSLGNRLGGTFAETLPSDFVGPPALVGHTGGVIGQDTMTQRSAFDRLRNGEQPIIVQKGEGIFTQQQMRSMAPLSAIEAMARRRPVQSGTQGLAQPVVNVSQPGTKVEVINQSGSEVEVQTETGADGTEIIRMVITAVATDIARDGDISKVMKGKFGLRNKTGLR